MLEQLNATIQLIYAAAADFKKWGNALSAIEELTGSVGAVIGFVPRRGGVTAFNLAGRFTEEQCETYSRDYQPICRRTRYMVEHPELPIVYDSLVLTEREMDSDAVYHWFGKHGLRYFAGTALPPTEYYQPVWTLQRSPAQGHMQRRDIALFQQITPHLGQALLLAEKLETMRGFRRFSATVLNALPDALFALNGSGEILFANAWGEAVLKSADGMRSVNRKLATVLPEEQASLERLVREAGLSDVATSKGWMRLSRAFGGPPYAVLVSPMDVEDEELLAAGAKVLVLVKDTGNLRSADSEMLVSIYGLTEAEAKLASALSAGHSMESAALLLGVGGATVRSHLKSIFAKLQVNRQQDLIRILASLSAMPEV